MKKCVIIPDSFKGTMSASEVCDIMKESVLKAFPECEIITVPVADGGEGTVDCFIRAFDSSEKINIKTKGPHFEQIDSFFGKIGDLGVIEMAASAGLSLAGGEPSPDKTTTYGVGELISAAIEKGCKKIILGLGGSCTNDGGTGMAAALGVKFYDKDGGSFIPVGGTLEKIARIDVSEAKNKLAQIDITAICDIDNPLFGERGAAYVFAPQKGANPQMVKILDDNLRSFSEAVKNSLEIDVSLIPGAGAAGGMGAGACAFIGAGLKRGIDVVLDAVRFEQIIKNCDCVFTGEGRLDAQSLSGKAVIGISRRAKRCGVPVIAVVGAFEGNKEEMESEGISQIVEVGTGRNSFDEIKKYCRADLKSAMEAICAKPFIKF